MTLRGLGIVNILFHLKTLFYIDDSLYLKIFNSQIIAYDWREQVTSIIITVKNSAVAVHRWLISTMRFTNVGLISLIIFKKKFNYMFSLILYCITLYM